DVVILEREAQRIDPAVAARANRVGPMLRQPLPCGLRLSAFVRLFQGRYVGRRWRGRSPQQGVQNKGPAQYRARPVGIRRHSQYRRHSEQTSEMSSFGELNPLRLLG